MLEIHNKKLRRKIQRRGTKGSMSQRGINDLSYQLEMSMN